MLIPTDGTISAKAKCMYGKRLRTNDYQDMLRKQSVKELTDFLKESTYYSSCLSHINSNQIHRGQLEELLRREVSQRYVRLCRYHFGFETDFYNFYFLRMEIEQLLRCIMSLNAGTMEHFIIELPAHLIKHASFDLLALAHIRSYDDLLDLLQHTPYRALLEELLHQPPINYTACEKALMEYYYHSLLDIVRHKFRGQTRKDLERIISVNITLSNIMLMYRMKTFFHFPAEEVKKQTLNENYRITKKRFEEFLSSGSPEEFLDVFRQTYYGKAIHGVTFTTFENYVTRILNQFNKKLMRFSTSAPAVLYAYMALNSIEVDNITSIIEGIRYQVPSGQIERLLVM